MPWADIKGVTRRRLGVTETIVLMVVGGRKVRMRLLTSNHAGVDALEAAIKRTIGA